MRVGFAKKNSDKNGPNSSLVLYYWYYHRYYQWYTVTPRSASTKYSNISVFCEHLKRSDPSIPGTPVVL
jgi:hypothetical protein